jgi:hypothetical protein
MATAMPVPKNGIHLLRNFCSEPINLRAEMGQNHYVVKNNQSENGCQRLMTRIWAFNRGRLILLRRRLGLPTLELDGLFHADSVHYQLKLLQNIGLVPQDVAFDRLVGQQLGHVTLRHHQVEQV